MPTKTKSAAPAAPKPQLTPGRLKPAEYVRSPFRVEPAAGAALEDVMAPDYFAHVASKLRAGDRLEIMPECMSWYAEALVVDATRLSARIAILTGPLELDVGERVLADDGYEARWISPALRFGVFRRSDEHLMIKNLETKADAEKWIAGRVGMKTVEKPASKRKG